MTEAVTKRLASINGAEEKLAKSYESLLVINPDLDRTLVSYQANKQVNGHRWCKYKEGFSGALIQYILRRTGVSRGTLLDPFVGSGTAVFEGSDIGMRATGIELLPCSAEIVAVREILRSGDGRAMAKQIREFALKRSWEKEGKRKSFKHLRITKGAFPSETERLLERYLYEAERKRSLQLRRVLRFAAMSILESISFTRKDGQYLRWDSRSGRRAGGKEFNKGPILGFNEAITTKLEQIAEDISGDGLLFDERNGAKGKGGVDLLSGSCLEILSTLPTSSFDAVITSPPYCNRYDYTRTYALELALMGIDEEGIRDLRQTMLSCTVENKAKENLETCIGKSLMKRAMSAFESQELLQEILGYLDWCREEGLLNNNGIARMVRNYFLEMALVVFECSRVLKLGAPFCMVNDNVRYQGAHIPVDLILSEFAKAAGMDVDCIWVLPRGKGNSSQQMGVHGRKEIRKCVYVWRVKSRRANRIRGCRCRSR